MDKAGRILRAQARRKQVFQTILPLLSEGLIRPAEGSRPARKDSRVIKEQVRALRSDVEDADAFMAMTNIIEQACNRYLQTESFPSTYEDLQPVPVLSVGQLTFAGYDGMKAGQAYRARIDVSQSWDQASRQEQERAPFYIRLRSPDQRLNWPSGHRTAP